MTANINVNNTPKTSDNIDKLTVIQLNTSNTDWDSKATELISTIVTNKADVCIVSESNAEINKPDKMTFRENMFNEYNIEDKTIKNQHKARVSIIINKKIKYTRCINLEDGNNSTIVIKI